MNEIQELTIHDRLDHVEADRVELTKKLKALADALTKERDENRRLRRECRPLAAKAEAFDKAGAALRQRAETFERAASAGDPIAEAIALEARAAVNIWLAAFGEGGDQ